MRSYKQMPKTIGAYADCKRALDAAITNGGARMNFETRGNAVHFRHRCNAFKRIMLDAAIEATKLTPGVIASTPYDSIYMTIGPDDTFVTIYPMRPNGQLQSLDGGALAAEPKLLELDPLEKEAEALKNELGL